MAVVNRSSHNFVEVDREKSRRKGRAFKGALQSIYSPGADESA